MNQLDIHPGEQAGPRGDGKPAEIHSITNPDNLLERIQWARSVRTGSGGTKRLLLYFATLPPGWIFMSVANMCADMEISRETFTQNYLKLEAAGWIETRRNMGRRGAPLEIRIMPENLDKSGPEAPIMPENLESTFQKTLKGFPENLDSLHIELERELEISNFSVQNPEAVPEPEAVPQEKNEKSISQSENPGDGQPEPEAEPLPVVGKIDLHEESARYVEEFGIPDRIIGDPEIDRTGDMVFNALPHIVDYYQTRHIPPKDRLKVDFQPDDMYGYHESDIADEAARRIGLNPDHDAALVWIGDTWAAFVEYHYEKGTITPTRELLWRKWLRKAVEIYKAKDRAWVESHRGDYD